MCEWLNPSLNLLNLTYCTQWHMISHQYTPHIRSTELSVVYLGTPYSFTFVLYSPYLPMPPGFFNTILPIPSRITSKITFFWRCISFQENQKIKLINWENFPRLRIAWKQDSSFKWIFEVVDPDTASLSEDGSRWLIHTDVLVSPPLPAMHRMENSPTSLKTHDGCCILNACVSLKVIY